MVTFISLIVLDEIMEFSLMLWIIGATLFSGLLGLTGGILLLWNQKFAKKISLGLVSFAAGTLLAGAFFHLIPETVEEAGAGVIPFVIGGICIFYVVEKLLIWHHCHDEHCIANPTKYTIIFGDSIHNFIDGVVIASAFLISIPVGIIAALAVLMHEIPQEIGDFAVLLHTGWKKKQAIMINVLSALVSVAGAVLAILFLPFFESFIPYVAAIAAGGFIYIATADLIPETHKEMHRKKSFWYAVLFFAGIGIMWGLGKVLGV